MSIPAPYGFVVPEDGDLAFVPIEGFFVVGIFNKGARTVVVGDFVLSYTPGSGGVGSRSRLLPSAGLLVGKRFSSIADCHAAVDPHRAHSVASPSLTTGGTK